MVNLRAVANRMTSGINPNICATVRKYRGLTTADSGRQEPLYGNPTPVVLQVQALTKKDVEHVSSLNIVDVEQTAYSNVELTGIDRTKNTGGDLLTFGGNDWIVSAVLEGWNATACWCKVALTRQLGRTYGP